MIVMAVVHKRNQDKREEEFNQQMEEKINGLTFEAAETATEA